MQYSLNDLIHYQHPGVVRRFKKQYPDKAPQAELIFEDLMRFFWASKIHEIEQKKNPKDESLDFVFIMDEDMKYIDFMWHVFLLYTQDYMDFCERYFGEYLHHLPDIVPNHLTETFDDELNLERFISNIYDQLGEAVVRRWFAQSLV